MTKNTLTMTLAEGSAPAVDAILTAVEHVPGLGIAVGILKAKDDYLSRMFKAKLRSFIEGLGNKTAEEIAAMGGKFEDPTQRESVAEALLLSLESYSSLDKCEMLGTVFQAFLKGVIDNTQLRRLALAIDKGFPDDLKRYAYEDIDESVLTPEFMESLMVSGLTKSNGGIDGGMAISTPLGKVFKSAMRC